MFLRALKFRGQAFLSSFDTVGRYAKSNGNVYAVRSKSGYLERIRDPKDITRYSGRPDDPPRKRIAKPIPSVPNVPIERIVKPKKSKTVAVDRKKDVITLQTSRKNSQVKSSQKLANFIKSIDRKFEQTKLNREYDDFSLPAGRGAITTSTVQISAPSAQRVEKSTRLPLTSSSGLKAPVLRPPQPAVTKSEKFPNAALKSLFEETSRGTQVSQKTATYEPKTKPADIKLPREKPLKIVKDEFDETSRHRVYSFGLTETGALGFYKPSEGRRFRKYINRPIRHRFAEELQVISAECGYGFTLFYVKSESNIKLYGCGINYDFQLGPIEEELVPYPTPMDLRLSSPKTKVISFSAGRAHSAVATDNEGIFLFGSNTYGQCGRSVKTEQKSGPTCTITQMQSLAGEKATSVTCGQDHTCFLSESGKVYSCGWSSEGQTGTGSSDVVDGISLVEGAIKGEKIVRIAGNCNTVLALNQNGELFGWGSNEFKQLINDIDQPNVYTPIHLKHVNQTCGKIIDISAGSTFCMILNSENDVYVWGYGILGGGPNLSKTAIPTLLPKALFGRNEYHPHVVPTRVYCGLDHFCIVNNLKHIYSWGKNKQGCLGIGNIQDQYFPYKLAVSADVLHASCSVDHSVLVTDHQ